jgi:hypothetical protein
MEAHMSGKWSDLEDFLKRPVSLTLERILMVDYLVAHGFLPCDLKGLPQEQATTLFTEARQFAKHELGDAEQTVAFSTYVPVGFSWN